MAFVAGPHLAPGATTWSIYIRDRATGTTRWVMGCGNSCLQGNGGPGDLTISADGNFIAFSSNSSNLVPGDTNGTGDVFVRNVATGALHRVSVSSTGAQGNGFSSGARISADGRYVEFFSDSTNLVPGDTNGVRDIFVRDRATGTTYRVSIPASGGQGNADSGACGAGAISAGGRFVAYESDASNLVSGDTNGVGDIFVRDRLLGTTTRVSISSTGAQSNGDTCAQPAISADGRFVVFASGATNLATTPPNNTSGDVYLRDRRYHTTRRISVSSSGVPGNQGSGDACISGDGRFVAFDSSATNLVPGDTNAAVDVFVRGPLAQ